MVRSKLKCAMTVTAMLALAAMATLPSGSKAMADGCGEDTYQELPKSITLTGIARDFRELSVTGGHPDFERVPTAGYGFYVNEVADELDAEGKPVYRSSGNRVNGHRMNPSNKQLMPVDKSYMNPNIKSGNNGLVSASAGGSITSESAFAQWYRDVPGVNVSKPVAITLKRQENSNVYTFDDKEDDYYKDRGGFFPLNGELFGNSAGDNKNFHFTYELATTFVYERGKGHVFTFTGDDDVFVFIGGKLVIDLGGVHAAISQSVELDTLTHLEDGRSYDLKLFFAERHRTQSNMRIDTTLNLINAEAPTVTGLFD